MRSFEYRSGTSHKFWTIRQTEEEIEVNYGRVGTTGQTQRKSFADAGAAKAAHDKLIREKLAKGYRETTASLGSATPLQRALEEAVLSKPDDLAAHSAYADLLMEQGDPRGEFIQAQLALEDLQ